MFFPSYIQGCLTGEGKSLSKRNIQKVRLRQSSIHSSDKDITRQNGFLVVPSRYLYNATY